jgi:hypothetical protein
VLTLAGGTRDLNGFDQTLTRLDLSAASTVRFSGDSTLFIIAVNTASAGNGAITLTDFVVGTNRVYINPSIGMTFAQLSQIQLAGHTVTGVNGSNYLTFAAIPEPGTLRRRRAV